MENSKSLDGRVRSRRDFFANAGAALATVGVVGSGALDKLQAQTAAGGGDLDILNFALRLERLEAAFYTQGLAKFSATDFSNSNLVKAFGGPSGNIYALFQLIQQHETTHVAQISAAVTQLGGTLAPQDCYSFSLYGTDLTTFKTVDSFIAVAMLLENTGVMAYDGAIGLITSPTLRTTAATIATVEARHASYLNLLNGATPFPAAFDSPASAADILAAASKFIANCGVFPPNAIAGPKNITGSGQGFQLDASKSTTASGGPVTSYLWEPVLGSNAKVSNPYIPNPTVTFLGGPGVYTFVLLVMDAFGNNSTDTVKVNYTGS